MTPALHGTVTMILSCALLVAACGGSGAPAASPAETSAPQLQLAAASSPDAGARGTTPSEPPAPAPASAPDSPSSSSCGATLPGLPGVPEGARLVTEFGATPDDETADDEAIARALNEIGAGDWLVFPPGRYIQDRSILITRPGVTLWGYGAELHATDPDDQTVGLRADGVRVYGFKLTAITTIRKHAPWQSRISIFRDADLPGRQSGNVVRGNVITHGVTAASANSASSAGIFVYNAQNFTVAENTVRRSLSDGIHVTHGSRNGRVVGNVVRQSGDDMIAIVSYLGNGWQQRLRTDSEWRAAVQSGAGPIVSDVLVQGNDVADQYWGRGISVIGGNDITIRSNTIANPTWGAGVIVAQEGSWVTAGVRNVLVQDNKVTRVQTSAPPYVPSGESFSAIRHRVATHQTSYHGGIEVHAIQNADAADPLLASALRVSDIEISGNEVTETRGDGIRVGVSTQPNLLDSVAVLHNRLARIGGAPINNLLASDKLACQGNTIDGTAASGSCSLATLPSVTGAALDCSALP